jgi:hypothetical protein
MCKLLKYKNIYTLYIFLFLLVFTKSAVAQKKAKEIPFHKQLKEIKTAISGIYEMRITDESLPAAARIPQDMLIFPIWEVKNEQWFYFAWINPQLKERPLEETLWRTYQDSTQPGKILFDLYRIPNSKNYQYEWRKKQPYADLNPDLIIGEGDRCAGELKILPEKVFQGISYEPCPREETGSSAAYTSLLVDFKFSPKGIITFGNKHYDNKGNIVMQFDHSVPAKKVNTKIQSY